MYVKVASKGYAFIMSLPCSPSDFIFFCALGHSWLVSKFIVSHSSQVEKRCNAASNLFGNPSSLGKSEHKCPDTLYGACFVEERECTVHMGCNSFCVKHIPQTARFVLLFQLPSLLKSVSVCDEGWVYLSKEAVLCSRELGNEWLWETSSWEAAWSREWAMHMICIWSSMCWAWGDWRILGYCDALVCPGEPAHQGWLACFSQVTNEWEVAMPKQLEW